MTVRVSAPHPVINQDKNTSPERFKYGLRDYTTIETVGTLVGSKTKGSQLELYFYAKDTSRVWSETHRIRDSLFRNWSLEIDVASDSNWDFYKNSLILKNVSHDELFMKKMYEFLREDGYPLTPARTITHEFYVRESGHTVTLIEYLKKEGYETAFKSGGKLWATKSESADPALSLPIIRKLRLKGKELNAPYAGISIAQVK